MTTNREIKKLFAPLLAKNSDLVTTKITRRLTLVVTPVHHILRAVFVDSSSNALRFAPHWLCNPLFRSASSFYFVGDEIYMPAGRPLWNWQIPESIDGFYEALDTNILPRLRACQKPSDIVTIGREKYMGIPSPFDAHGHDFLVLLADGRIAEAVVSLDMWYDKNRFVIALDAEEPGLAQRIKTERDALSKADRRRIADIFHMWERRKVVDWQLDHLWEETPFGIETGL
jgi:hypothetical protein